MRKIAGIALAAVLTAFIFDHAVSAASLNALTLLFGSVKPSSAAAPRSCIALSATSKYALNIDHTSTAALPPPSFTTTIQLCPPQDVTNLEAPVPFSLLFEDLSASTDTAEAALDTHLLLEVQATQPAAAPANTELRWSGIVSLSFGTAAQFDLDFSKAELHRVHPPPFKAPKPPKMMQEVHHNAAKAARSLAVCPPVANNATSGGEQHPLENSTGSSSSTSLAAAAAVLSLSSGIAAGIALSVKMTTSKKPQIVTCEVACSPFVGVRRRSHGKHGGCGGGEKYKWTRDNEGRLQRENKQSNGGGAVAAAIVEVAAGEKMRFGGAAPVAMAPPEE